MTLTDTSPTIRRVRHDLVSRELTVAATRRVTPRMLRLTLTGETLDSFASASFDDHFKLFIPGPDGELVGREYTPRHIDPARRELTMDVVDHVGGPAADWARGAEVGDTVNIGGPRGSAVIEGDIAAWLLVGDETAIPAIARHLAELPAGTPVRALIAVDGPAEEQAFDTEAALELTWLHRPFGQSADPAPVLAALDGIELAPRTFVWVAAEAGVARTVRRHLMDERGHPKVWMKAAGYWTKGSADTSEKSIDEG